MCITFFCICPSSAPSLQLLFSFNREQSTHRDTVPFHRFEEDPNIYAGRDMVSKGSWLGFNQVTGLLVVLTNYETEVKRMLKSRGQLVLGFLKTSFVTESDLPHLDEIVYKTLDQVCHEGKEYSPFNLTVVNLRTGVAYYICSETPGTPPRLLSKAVIHGICNSHYDEVWPKTERGIKLFGQVVDKAGQLNEEGLMKGMQSVMRDNFRFSKNDEDESSIFVEPYQSIEGGQRKTKTSMFLMLRQVGEKRQVLVKEVTFGKQSESEVVFRLFL